MGRIPAAGDEADILEGGVSLKQAVLLENRRKGAALQALYGSGISGLQSHEDPEKRGLSRARGSHKAAGTAAFQI